MVGVGVGVFTRLLWGREVATALSVKATLAVGSKVT
jgi:hypothetical protein